MRRLSWAKPEDAKLFDTNLTNEISQARSSGEHLAVEGGLEGSSDLAVPPANRRRDGKTDSIKETIMAKEKIEKPGNEATNDVEDLTLNETAAEKVEGGSIIPVHYDKGYGKRITIRGSQSDSNRID